MLFCKMRCLYIVSVFVLLRLANAFASVNICFLISRRRDSAVRTKSIYSIR